MVEKENLTPGFRFEQLFSGIRSQEFIVLIADTLLFFVIGVLAVIAILSLSLDFGQNISFIIVAVAVLVAILLIGLYLAARKSIKRVKSEAR
ncbi:hypothetical protein [Methanocella arvoryzae]|nr:hypothetical protein [Methanocella arvoryzae]